MKIHIPKDIGDELPLLPDGPCTAVPKDISSKKSSKSGTVMLYVKWIVTSEMYTDDEKSSIGEPILDGYALVDQALWRLNNLYKEATGEDIPEGDYEVEDIVNLVKEKIIGIEFNLLLQAETYEGKTRTKVQAVSKEPFESGPQPSIVDEIP